MKEKDRSEALGSILAGRTFDEAIVSLSCAHKIAYVGHVVGTGKTPNWSMMDPLNSSAARVREDALIKVCGKWADES